MGAGREPRGGAGPWLVTVCRGFHVHVWRGCSMSQQLERGSAGDRRHPWPPPESYCTSVPASVALPSSRPAVWMLVLGHSCVPVCLQRLVHGGTSEDPPLPIPLSFRDMEQLGHAGGHCLISSGTQGPSSAGRRGWGPWTQTNVCRKGPTPAKLLASCPLPWGSRSPPPALEKRVPCTVVSNLPHPVS